MFSCFNFLFVIEFDCHFTRQKLFDVIGSHGRPHQTSTMRWATKMYRQDTSQSITWQQLGAFKHVEGVHVSGSSATWMWHDYCCCQTGRSETQTADFLLLIFTCCKFYLKKKKKKKKEIKHRLHCSDVEDNVRGEWADMYSTCTVLVVPTVGVRAKTAGRSCSSALAGGKWSLQSTGINQAS